LQDVILKSDFMSFPHPLSNWLSVPIIPLYCLLTLLYQSVFLFEVPIEVATFLHDTGAWTWREHLVVILII
jgi:hypothetical protein